MLCCNVFILWILYLHDSKLVSAIILSAIKSLILSAIKCTTICCCLMLCHNRLNKYNQMQKLVTFFPVSNETFDWVETGKYECILTSNSWDIPVLLSCTSPPHTFLHVFACWMFVLCHFNWINCNQYLLMWILFAIARAKRSKISNSFSHRANTNNFLQKSPSC